MAAISSWVSKVSACQPDMVNDDILESQPLLSNRDQASETSHPENLPIPDKEEKLTPPSNLEEACKPPKAEKSMKTSSPEKSCAPHSTNKLNKQSVSRKSSKFSNSQRYKSSHVEKHYKKHNLKKSQKLTHASKLISQERSSYLDKQFMPPWLSVLQASGILASYYCPPLSQNQSLLPRSFTVRKPNVSRGHHNLKKSISVGHALLLTKPSLANTCRRYKERCLVCNSSSDVLVNNISEAKKEHTGNHYAPRKIKPSPKCHPEADYKHNTCRDIMSKTHKKTLESEDSDQEIVIICDMQNDNIILRGN